MGLQFVTRVTIPREDKRDVIPLLPIGDMHYGAEDCNEVCLDCYLRFAEKEKAYLCGMGDMLDLHLPKVIPHAVWSDIKRPSDQEKDFILNYKRFNWLWMIPGTHEWWSKMLVDAEPIERIATAFNAEYLPFEGYVEVRVPPESYLFYVHHGSGSSQRAGYQLEKAAQIYDAADVIMVGHIHYVYCDEAVRIRVDKGREYEHVIKLVRTGGFLTYPKYARNKLMKPVKPGAPIIYLHRKEHLVDVDTSRFPERKYALR
jgi:hypothetical protein